MAILKQAPDGAQVLDLVAARTARAEARAASGQSQSFLKLSAGFVEVRPEFPLSAAYDLMQENVPEGLAGLLVDPKDADALLADGLTAQDLSEIAQFISGKTLGESLASPKPLKNSGKK